ncbi:hypothetical protein QN277_016381 [Acacia crassicarpa]|uniref:RRM domain-containing protein n=1 Tax=Acacia crassicarpa TaxID=499986 RepID=A0AAE1MWI9_9FABA|nr:hypothetical protein QN277_016381 [Acacia crassicarpa]
MAAADAGYTCRVSGLTRDTDREALLEAFASFDKITDSKVVNNCGFITFSSEQAMRDPVDGMNGQDLDGCNINVSKHLGRPNGGSGDHGGGSSVPICRLDILRSPDVRLFRLGSLVGRLTLISGGDGLRRLGLGLRFGSRSLGLSLGVSHHHVGFGLCVRRGVTVAVRVSHGCFSIAVCRARKKKRVGIF